MPSNYIVIDTETTGLDVELGHEIIQISAKVIDGASLGDHHAGHKQWLIKPQTPELADPGALKVVGPLFEKAKAEGLEPLAVYRDLIRFCESANPTGGKYDKPIFVAYNALFDWNFIRGSLRKYKLMNSSDEWPFSYAPFDVRQSFQELFHNDRAIKNHKLDTALSVFGLERVTANNHHDAHEDVALTAELFVKFMKLFRQVRGKLQIGTK